MKRANLPPAWESALSSWVIQLRQEGKTEGTIRIRYEHMRSIAVLSHTVWPGAFTADEFAGLARWQDWAPDYQADVQTSVKSFYHWALTNGHV